MSYSEKFRKEVLRKIEEGKSLQEVANQFTIGTATISRWRKKKRETGSVKATNPRRPWRKIDPNKLKSYVDRNPGKICKEYAAYFNVTTVSIWHALKKLGYSVKKRPSGIKNGMSKNVWYIPKK